MAHHKSAIKRIRQDKVRTLRNKAKRTRVRNAIKGVRNALSSGNLEEARAKFQVMVPIVDRMAAKGIIHRNTASRTKSRLNRNIQFLAVKNS